MSVKDLISAAFNKDANSFESTLHAIMQEKMSAAIQARFSPAVYEEEVNLDEAKDDSEDDESTEEDDDEEDMKEEAEQIDELSRKTLSSYVKKAAGVGHRNTLPNAMRDRATAASIGDKEWYKQSGRNADNRSKGIQRAADRLAKEETEE